MRNVFALILMMLIVLSVYTGHVESKNTYDDFESGSIGYINFLAGESSITSDPDKVILLIQMQTKSDLNVIQHIQLHSSTK